MNKSKAWSIGFAAVVLASGIAQAASDVQDTTVTQLRIDAQTGKGVISFASTSTAGKPSCSTYDAGVGRTLSVDTNTDGGREAWKLAQSAYLAGKKVRFTGSGTCTVQGNKEDLVSLYVYTSTLVP